MFEVLPGVIYQRISVPTLDEASYDDSETLATFFLHDSHPEPSTSVERNSVVYDIAKRNRVACHNWKVSWN